MRQTEQNANFSAEICEGTLFPTRFEKRVKGNPDIFFNFGEKRQNFFFTLL